MAKLSACTDLDEKSPNLAHPAMGHDTHKSQLNISIRLRLKHKARKANKQKEKALTYAMEVTGTTEREERNALRYRVIRMLVVEGRRGGSGLSPTKARPFIRKSTWHDKIRRNLSGWKALIGARKIQHIPPR